MSSNIERARELLPVVVITVLSMIQALALELFWNRLEQSEYLWQPGWDSVLGWFQLIVMFLGILQIWLVYVSFVLRFSWLPTMEDTITPFIIGILEFAMIDLMGPDTFGPWFLMLAAVFGVSVGASHLVLRRARRDSSNDYFFTSVERATWKDYRLSVAMIGFLALLGLALWWSNGPSHGLALFSLTVAFAALTYQLYNTHRYWLIEPTTTLKEDT